MHYIPDWQTGLSGTLWVTITASMVLYAIVAFAFPQAWRLSPLIAGYMMLLGLAAILLHNADGVSLQAGPVIALGSACTLLPLSLRMALSPSPR